MGGKFMKMLTATTPSQRERRCYYSPLGFILRDIHASLHAALTGGMPGSIRLP